MKKNLFLIIICGILFNACKNQEEKITIIDQLPLGVTIDTLNKEFEKRNLYDNFTNSIIITSIEELRNNLKRNLWVVSVLTCNFAKEGTILNDEEEDIVIYHLRDKYEIY